MAELADLTYGSLAYDPLSTAAPQIDFPPEPEAPPRPAEEPRPYAQPRQRVRLGTREELAALAAGRRRTALAAAVLVPLAAACLVLVVMLLQAHIRLAAVSDEAAALETRIAELRAVRARLEIQSESAFNMEEVEQTARTVIGMIKADSDQVSYLRSTSQDVAVILEAGRREATVWSRLNGFFERIGAYFAAVPS